MHRTAPPPPAATLPLTTTTTLDIARTYRTGGLSIVPIRADGSKAAAVKWEPYQSRLADYEELLKWFANGTPRGIAVVYGKISGNAECVDIDEAELYGPFAAEVDRLAPGLLDRLTIIRTPRPGCHIIYRCEAVEGNQKLAMGVRDGKPKAVIETRGTGGYALAPGCPAACHPTGGTYDHLSGPSLDKLATITPQERAILFRVARSFNEVVDEEPQAASNGRAGLSPGDDYNKRATWEEILEPHGWVVSHARGNVTHWRRPGKQVGWSATSGIVSKAGNDLFCCFSDNAHPFQGANGGNACSTYSKFAAFAVLHHGADFAAAARDLAGKGYGERRETREHHRTEEYREAVKPLPPVKRYTFRELRASYPHLKPVVIEGLLRQGETCNIISTSKVGKSWLAYSLALSVIAGREWLGAFATTPGKVLIIDNELHPETISNRIPAVADAMGVPPEYADSDLEVWPLRGNLRSLHELGEDLDRIKPGEFKIVILDAKYRFATGQSENDNAAETVLYNLLDRYTETLQAAFVLIHHSSKGNQSDKRTTDVGAGAGAQSRAADCHLVLREHEEEGVVVLEAAVRSFKPVEPLALRWNFPLWVPASGIDPKLLKGRLAPKKQQQSEEDQTNSDKILKALATIGGAASSSEVGRKSGVSREVRNRLLERLEAQEEITSEENTKRGNPCRVYSLKEQPE